MNKDEIKNKILNFLSKHNLTVISTVDIKNNKPESAVIAFAEKDNLEIIFGTSNTTRKYKNIKKNPNVSFVTGWSSDIGTVQYEGTAEELSKVESTAFSAIMVKKNPQSEKFVQREDQRYFIVKPKWIRILDMTQNPDVTYEISF